MSSRHRRKRFLRLDVFRGLIIGFFGLLLLSGLGGVYYWRLQFNEPLDAAHCPKSGPTSIHLIIIDRSDPISDFQAQRIRQVLGKAKDDAAVGTRFDIFTFEGDTGKRLDPILSICTPQKPETANELYENKQRIRRRYEEAFSKVLDDTIGTLLKASSAPSSPIIESLRGAAQTAYGAQLATATSKRITLISDMVQHSALHSHFTVSQYFLFSQNLMNGRSCDRICKVQRLT